MLPLAWASSDLPNPPTHPITIIYHHHLLSPLPSPVVGGGGGRGPSVKSRFWSSSSASSSSSSSAVDQIVEFFSRSRSVLRRDVRHARHALVECSPTSDNIMLDPQPCCIHCLRNPRWCPFHCLTRVSLSLDRVSRSFPHSNTSFNFLARYAVAILPRSVVAPPMLCHHSPR